jgi:hypothetical protein
VRSSLQQIEQAAVEQEVRLRGVAEHVEPAACAACAMAVKSTWAVMSFRPGSHSGSACA